jgi:hypothetical protein
MTFTPILHQFTLFDYNAMRPVGKVPIKRISRARYDEALKQLRGGKNRNMVGILRDINDALERYNQRLTNKRF